MAFPGPIPLAILASVILSAVAVSWYVTVMLRRSRRPWWPAHDELPRTTVRGDVLTVSRLRRARWTSADTYTMRRQTVTVRLSRLRRVWFAHEIFDRRGFLAHTMLHFEFDRETLCCSIEARKRLRPTSDAVQEPFNALRGLLPYYQVGWFWTDEEDSLGFRAGLRKHPVTLCPLRLTHDQARSLLLAMAEESDAVNTSRRWYHTIGYNCTNVLVRHLNRVLDRPIPLRPSRVVTGHLDRLFLARGLYDTTVPPSAFRRTWSVVDRATRWTRSGGRGDYGVWIRADLPRHARTAPRSGTAGKRI
jgi:hypothetical protein